MVCTTAGQKIPDEGVSALTYTHAGCQAGDGVLEALRLIQGLHVAAQHPLAHLALCPHNLLQQPVRGHSLHVGTAHVRLLGLELPHAFCESHKR